MGLLHRFIRAMNKLMSSNSEILQEFIDFVEDTLKSKMMGKEVCDRLWGQTPQGQLFVFITSKVLCYAVKLIVDEEYRDYEVVREFEVRDSQVLSKKYFATLEGAQMYALKEHANFEKGIFGEYFSYRIRKLPSNAFDTHLKFGDHIQRTLDAFIPFANHEGVYLGDGLVAHINTEKLNADKKTVIAEKLEAHARIDPINAFTVSDNQEIRIVVHCFRQRSREEIRSTAMRLANNDVTPEERYHTGEYHFLKQNCQHFATYCVLGRQRMSDQGPFMNKMLIATALLLGNKAADTFISRKKLEAPEESNNE